MSIKDGNCHHCGDLVHVAEHVCRKIDPDTYSKIVRVGLDAQREYIKDMSDDTIATLVSVTGRFGGGTSQQIDRMLAREIADRFKGHIGTFERDAENDYMGVLQHGAFSVSTIAKRLDISLSTASRGLAKLQRKGLVVAEDDEDDGRKRIYALVEKGR
jgi:DNA-binding transcriptional ArsR family regulator